MLSLFNNLLKNVFAILQQPASMWYLVSFRKERDQIREKQSAFSASVNTEKGLCSDSTFVRTGIRTRSYRIGLEDGSLFFFRDKYIFPNDSFIANLAVGVDCTMEEVSSLRDACECLIVEKKALSLIARQEQHSRGIFAKLLARKYSEHQIQRVINFLQSEKLLDDVRYCVFWIESRIRNKPESRMALRSLLLKKGLSEEAVKKAILAVYSVERELEILEHFCISAGINPVRVSAEERHLILKKGFSLSMLRELSERQ